MGNHDYYLVSGNNCPRSNSVNITIEYQRKIITKSNYLWLTESAPFIDTVYVSLRHGGWNDPLDEYIVEFNWNSVKSFPQLVFISGHTHKQSYQVYNNRVYANPGSVGQPRDYDNRAGYLTLSDTGKIELHRVEYPIEDIIRKSEIAGFESRISSCLRTGTRIGELD
jgi:predicted phosphodiesterase